MEAIGALLGLPVRNVHDRLRRRRPLLQLERLARFIAERLGLEVIEKRASDLLSMWVGENEKNIAAAFAEASDRRAILVIDEADSLLHDRAGAQRPWEVSLVNEMLTWMERHPYPFVCTTNAMESLDPATLRRFLFKVEFLPMTAAQAREAFRRAFGADAPAALDRLDPLTPGDFAVVARKARVLDASFDRLSPTLATAFLGCRPSAAWTLEARRGLRAPPERGEDP